MTRWRKHIIKSDLKYEGGGIFEPQTRRVLASVHLATDLRNKVSRSVRSEFNTVTQQSGPVRWHTHKHKHTAWKHVVAEVPSRKRVNSELRPHANATKQAKVCSHTQKDLLPVLEKLDSWSPSKQAKRGRRRGEPPGGRTEPYSPRGEVRTVPKKKRGKEKASPHGPRRCSTVRAPHPAVSFLCPLSSARCSAATATAVDKFADVNKLSVWTGTALWSQLE